MKLVEEYNILIGVSSIFWYLETASAIHLLRFLQQLFCWQCKYLFYAAPFYYESENFITYTYLRHLP